MKLWGIIFSRLRILFILLLVFVVLTPWLVEWVHPATPFHWKRPLTGSLLLLAIVAAVLASARREILLRREAEKRYKEFLDDAPLGTFSIDLQGRFVYVNKKFLDLTGYALEEMLGRPWQEMAAREEIPMVAQLIEDAYGGKEENPAPFEVRAYHRGGGILHLILHYTALKREGTPESILVVAQDMTQRRKLEAQLVKSERLAVAGQLAMGLAHEINNPLSIIKTSLRLLKDRVITGEEVDETFEDIQEEVDRIAGMVRVLLGFRDARPGEEPVTDVDEAVQSLLHLMGPQLKDGKVETGFSWIGEKASAAVRPGQFRQIFFNLIRNALDAMPEGGRLNMSCRAEDGRVCIRVEDSGVGIPFRDQERLYEPFFSTKSSSHHGLGLYVCYTILKSVGGKIEAESKVGEGTVFSVCLPLALTP